MQIALKFVNMAE